MLCFILITITSFINLTILKMKPKKVFTKNEMGFYTNFTKEDALNSLQELKEIGKCPMTNPEFYQLTKWDDPNEVKEEETKRLERERRLKVRQLVKEMESNRSKYKKT
jgi:hypothetical protein